MFLFPYGVSYGTLKYQVMGFSFRLYISICKFTGPIIEFVYFTMGLVMGIYYTILSNYLFDYKIPYRILLGP